MTDKAPSGSGKQRDVRVAQLDLAQGGYQPQVPGPVNLATLKPPRGGSAIERPEKPATSK